MSVDKKLISSYIEWYMYIGNILVCAHLSSNLAHGTYCLCSITQLFRLLGIVNIFPMSMPKPCSGDLKHIRKKVPHVFMVSLGSDPTNGMFVDGDVM